MSWREGMDGNGLRTKKIVEACRRIGMLTAFRTFCKNNQFLSQRDRFFKFTLMIELHDLAVQFWRVIILSWSPRVNYEDRTKRQEQNDYVDWSGKRTWPLNFHCSVAGPITWPREGVFRHRLQWVLQDQVRVDESRVTPTFTLTFMDAAHRGVVLG